MAALGLYSDANEAALKPILASVRKHSKAAVAMQLAHAGRKGSSARPWDGGQQIPIAQGGWQTVAPSAVPHKDGEAAPAALDDAGLARIRDAFVDSARRAERLGIDALELHGAHGYLLHQFLSPISNKRTDKYGGSLENRMRYPLEIYDAVRAVFPQRQADRRARVLDRLGRWRLGPGANDSNLPKQLKQRGVDWIDASSGGVSPLQKIALGPGYQVPFAQAIRQATGVTTMAVGLITEPSQAEDIVAQGQGRHGHAGARHAVRPALGLARRGRAARRGDGAAAILALAALEPEGAVRRHHIRCAITRAANARISA